MNWYILVVAGILEVGWAMGLKYSEGFTRLIPSTLTIICILLSLGLLSIAMKGLPLGTAYAVWVGIGAIGTAVCGTVLFGESTSFLRVASLSLIVTGIIGLELATPT